MENLLAARLGIGLTDDDGTRLFLVVAFGIDEAELIGPLEQRFDDAPRNGGLAARGSAAHENTVAVGFEHDGHAVLVDAERESLAEQESRPCRFPPLPERILADKDLQSGVNFD